MEIALIDDHKILLESLENLLLSHLKNTSIKRYSDALSFFEDSETHGQLIVISDLNMPGMNGINFTEKCRTMFGNNLKIVILSMLNDTQTVKKLIRIGANAFVSKADDFEELLMAINEVNKGRSYISKSIKDLMIENMFTQDQVIYHLSPRETEVLNFVCQGKTIKEIAFEMKLSANTIQYYHKCIMNKFRLKRTTDLVVFAIKNGFYITQLTPSK